MYIILVHIYSSLWIPGLLYTLAVTCGVTSVVGMDLLVFSLNWENFHPIIKSRFSIIHIFT